MSYELTKNPDILNEYLVQSQHLIPSNKLWEVAKAIDLSERESFYQALQSTGF